MTSGALRVEAPAGLHVPAELVRELETAYRTPERHYHTMAHAWDVAGALRAGTAAAFVARPGMVLDPLAPRPDIVGSNLGEVVDRILATDLASL